MEIPITGPGIPPHRATANSAGADVFAFEDAQIAPGERKLVSTGLKMAIPEGYVGLVRPRSGLAVREGIHTMAGVIDSDYRGEVKILLINLGRRVFPVHKGDRIAQILIQRVEPATFTPVSDLPESDRGGGGFGSTGR